LNREGRKGHEDFQGNEKGLNSSSFFFSS